MYHIINNEKKLNSIAIGGWFTRGSFNDPVGKEGEHHFLEHIIFNLPFVKYRTDKYKDKGLVINAFTSHELMCFYIVCVEDNYSEAYEYIYDLLNIQFDFSEEVGFENERLIIKREIEYHFNYVEEMKRQLLLQMFGKGCANFSIMGSLESVDNITPTDIVNVYKSLLSGYKFITIVGNNLPVSNSLNDKPNIAPDKFMEIKASGKDRFIDDSGDCEYCYYGLSRFFSKSLRNAGLVYTKYIKETLFIKLREEKGLIYRINSANMNLSCGLIAFWIFKIRRQDIGLVQDIVKNLFSSKPELHDLLRYEQRLKIRNLINSDNITSEMLSMGYGRTILYGEDQDKLSFDEFFGFLELGKEDYYQRIIGIRA